MRLGEFTDGTICPLERRDDAKPVHCPEKDLIAMGLPSISRISGKLFCES
jgi:hypothetical protein